MHAGRPFGVILIVEDEWLLRDQAVASFKEAGWDVLEAGTAEGALQHLEAAGDQIHAVFTDIALSGYLSGWDVAEAFRSRYPAKPVVYASGNTIDRLRQVEASHFFNKPYKMDAIIALCRRAK
jgi:DNA-binding NtrC family response regulator